MIPVALINVLVTSPGMFALAIAASCCHNVCRRDCLRLDGSQLPSGTNRGKSSTLLSNQTGAFCPTLNCAWVREPVSIVRMLHTANNGGEYNN